MKKLLHENKAFILAVLVSAGFIGFLTAASSNTTGQREYESYVDTGDCMWHEHGTTSGTAGNISTVTVPTCAKGFRITPVTTSVSFKVGIAGSGFVEAPLSSSAGVAITTTTLNVGNRAKNDVSEVRLLPADETTPRQRFIYILSAGTSVVYYIEFF